MTISNTLITKINSCTETLLRKYIATQIKRTGSELCAKFGKDVPFTVSYEANPNLGQFIPKFQKGVLISAEIKIYVKTLILSTLKMRAPNTPFRQIFKSIKNELIAVCAHEYGHFLQVSRFENYYSDFYKVINGERILFNDAVLKHSKIETLILDKGFQSSIFELSRSLVLLERDANRFAVAFLNEKGITQRPSAMITDYNTHDLRLDFTLGYVIPNVRNYLNVITKEFYCQYSSLSKINELSSILSLVVCNLANETTLEGIVNQNIA